MRKPFRQKLKVSSTGFEPAILLMKILLYVSMYGGYRNRWRPYHPAYSRSEAMFPYEFRTNLYTLVRDDGLEPPTSNL